MTNFREKHNLRLRYCKLKISPDCLKIFRSKSKRPFACENCLKFLHNLGISIERYKRMETKESIKWIDKDKGVMNVFNETVVKNVDGKAIGKKTESFEIETTYDEISEGLDVVKERLGKNEKELDKINKQIDKFGKTPVMSNDLIRLKKNLELLTKAEKYKEFQMKLEPIEQQIEMDKEFIIKRSEILESRPE